MVIHLQSILIYIITITLGIVFIYLDMEKDETLEHYFYEVSLSVFAFFLICPFVNISMVSYLYIVKTCTIISNKIKLLKK